MTLYFGLKINRVLTDISDRIAALKNINIDIKDLDKIRGISDPAGVSKTDLKCLSGLDFDIEKAAVSLNQDSKTYGIVSEYAYDERSYIRGNLVISGQLAATSIKYAYLDDNNQANTADISTSRVSAWSSFDNPQLLTSPIVYGGEVNVEGNVELSSITINAVPIARRFEAEVPTHKIFTKIGGVNTYLYAMKGIPLQFKGFFRNLDPFVFVTITNNLRPSWVIKNDGTSTEYVFENIAGPRSAITFRDTSARLRSIDFYYPVDYITGISMPNAGLTELPSVSLPALNFLYINNNDLREFPLLTNFTALTELKINNNNLKRAKTAALTSFSQDVVTNRFPPNLTKIFMGNCFDGKVTASLASTKITYLDLNAENINNRRLSNTTPAVNSSIIEYYNCTFNLFDTVDTSLKNAGKLKEIDLSHNPILQSNLEFNSTEMVRFAIFGGNARINMVNLSGRTNLVEYTSSYNTFIPGVTQNNVEGIFNNCTNLKYVNLNFTNAAGKFPAFRGCNSLIGINFYQTNIASATDTNVIDESTFEACRNTLVYMTWFSPNITDVPFHPNSFRNMIRLDYVWISSQGQGIRGPAPSFNNCPSLRWLIIHWNKQFGYSPDTLTRHTMPTMDTNDNIFFYHITWHAFGGPVPNIKKPSLRYLICYGGKLNKFNKIESTNLLVLHLYLNEIPEIPDLSNLTSLLEVYLNNNQIKTYTNGAFATQTSLRILDISNNKFNENSSINITDRIIIDLYANYRASNRGGVYVNLSGNQRPPSNNPTVVSYLAFLRGAGWTIVTD